MRDTLLECCALDWSQISPAIFGALFQSVIDHKVRRNLGAHYTTEKNILKLIHPLFLDELRAEFEQVKGNTKKLKEFHSKLGKLKFLDPACGCGNFLVIAYREIRLLEIDILRVLLTKERSTQLTTNVLDFGVLCDVDQFYGIEIEEFPAQIAQTALWLMDHQMNMLVSSEFGGYFIRLPLVKSATIIHGNALQKDWHEVVEPTELNYILGNPPFIGKTYQNATQKSDLAKVFDGLKNAKLLDFVSAWYRKSVDFMADNIAIKTAFVSTNSITQGEQVGVLWPDLLQRGVKIHFAHRTFEWSSESSGKAAVHCVIIGFSLHDAPEKRLFEYEALNAEAYKIRANNINPYLVDAANTIIIKRTKPIENIPNIRYGSKPADGGFLILTKEEKEHLVSSEPDSEEWLRKYIGSNELINGNFRWCLWLQDIKPEILKKLPYILKRIDAVRSFRSISDDKNTRDWADKPALFQTNRQPTATYLAIPEVSSERRKYIPICLLPKETIASNLLYTISDSNIYHFGILTSSMHMAWMRSIGGRLESRYRYSAGIVYNNFPWPQAMTEKQKLTIEKAAQEVLDARAKFPNSSLADLYDPLTMPPELVKAHHKLDATVDAAYSKKKFSGDSDRVAFLFELYQQLHKPLVTNNTRNHVSENQ